MAAPLNVMGMAKVLTGWTGSLTVTVGGVAVAVTPQASTSAIVLAMRVGDILRAFGLSGVQYASSTGVLGWDASGTFTLAATGVIATRMGLAASSTGTTVTGTGAHQDGFYPEHGMSLDVPVGSFAVVPSLADGSAAVGPLNASQSLRLTAHGDLDDIWTLEAAFNTDQPWDLWAAGVHRARLKVNSVSRERVGLGVSASPVGRLSIQATSYQDVVRA